MNRVSKFAPAIAGLLVLLASGPSQAGQPPCTTSDSSGNTACGTGALQSNAGGVFNTAVGESTLYYNTTGNNNTAVGWSALQDNTTGIRNTAIGLQALYSNTTGAANTASGEGALYSNTTGMGNTADGINALYYNTADDNTATGVAALGDNTTGANNTANGYEALRYNTTGGSDTADGYSALLNNSTGSDNTADGYQALLDTTTGGGNTAFGANAGAKNTTGVNNTFIGNDARPNRDNYRNGTALGYGAVVTASNSIVLGDTAISKIYAEVSSITAISDRRRKKDIAPLGPDLGLAFIAKLRPVSYRYNNGDETQRYGFIAQDLEQALPATLHDTVEKSQPEHGVALIERENDAKRTYRVAYGELTAPLVKAVQEQQQQIGVQEREIAALRTDNVQLREIVMALKRQIGAMKLAQP